MALLLMLGPMGSVLAQHAGGHGGSAHLTGGAHQHLDARFSHNQYYYDRGYMVNRPPAGGLGEFRGPDGGRYWLHGGHWYRWDRGGWVVWGAPLGLFIPFLPFYFTTVWWDGIPYYYANDAYYLWNETQHGYEVVTPPAGMESSGATQGPLTSELMVYPKNGQTTQQQKTDRDECHRWAVSQSGYDPTAPGANGASSEVAARRIEHFRAEAACLEGRGYSVK
jgi:hypothetical protein